MGARDDDLKDRPKLFFHKLYDWVKFPLIANLLFWGGVGLDNLKNYDRRFLSEKQVTTSLVASPSSPQGTDVALLISGLGKLEERSHISQAYTALRKRGYADENIILVSSKLPPGRTLESGINAQATAGNARQLIEYAGKAAGKNGSLFLYSMVHGVRVPKTKSYELVFRDGKIDSRDLTDILSHSQCSKILAFEQCYGAGFFKDLKKVKGNVVAVAGSAEDKMNYALQTKYSSFWKAIGEGEPFLQAYRSSVAHALKTEPVRSTFSNVIGAETGMYLYKHGVAHLPTNPKNRSLLPARSTSEPVHSSTLEQKILPVFLTISLGFLFLAVFTPTFTGHIIQNTSFLFSPFSKFIFFVLFCGGVFCLYTLLRK